MEDRRSVPDWGGAAPLILVFAYFALVASHPAVPVGQLVALSLQYVGLSFALLMLTALFSFVGLLVVKMVRRDFAERPALIALRFVAERWRQDRLVSLIAPVLVFAVLLTSFNAYKQAILPLAGFGLDPLFADWDRALFLGTDPWRISHGLFPDAADSLLISLLYHQWFLPMAAGVFLCAFLPVAAALRTQYLLSYALIWILIGSVLAFLLPSAGPPFWSQFHGGPDPFAPLMERLAGQDRLLIASGNADGLSAYRFQRVLADSFGASELAIGRGISAMPSVHNALAVQFACAAFALDRRLGWIAAAYALAIWVGSIHLGWHYAIDGIAAAVLTIGLWYGCGAMARRLHARRGHGWRAAPAPRLCGSGAAE